VLATAAPSSLRSKIDANPGLAYKITVTTESWYTALPSEVKSFVASVDSRQVALATGAAASRPTGVMGVGAAVAGGLVGAALML
jgi:hypothetical protein